MADVIIPPPNFAMVARGIYRSGYPKVENCTFLKRLHLRSIVYLCPEETTELSSFYVENNITVVQFGIQGNKEPFIEMPEDVIRQALQVILDVRYHPLLVHCNKGKHRTGCLIGCLRKIQCWTLSSIFGEYRVFAGMKARMLDQQFIELFQPELVQYNPRYKPEWMEGRENHCRGMKQSNSCCQETRACCFTTIK